MKVYVYEVIQCFSYIKTIVVSIAVPLTPVTLLVRHARQHTYGYCQAQVPMQVPKSPSTKSPKFKYRGLELTL